MHGVMKNIAHMCSLQNSKVWGPDGWKKIVVSIVADGRQIISKRVLSVLAAMGIYQSGIAKNMVDDKHVKAHIYEFTTQLSVDSDMKLKGADKVSFAFGCTVLTASYRVGDSPCSNDFLFKGEERKKD